ncbi:hypothetical protein CEXT_747911 [Caerostris extrusa]|uniref:Uncharacterized protein n=1 Tax=Caerostris extrusa TaxID=172846 RepID=A0AAV4T7R8_CAEEX|nr:hypothetical protein CEXT_747911 [Caerostris extrusa]
MSLPKHNLQRPPLCSLSGITVAGTALVVYAQYLSRGVQYLSRGVSCSIVVYTQYSHGITQYPSSARGPIRGHCNHCCSSTLTIYMSVHNLLVGCGFYSYM